MTPAEKNTMAKDVNQQMVNPDNPSGNPLVRDFNQPGGRFGVDDIRPGKGIRPKAAPKSP